MILLHDFSVVYVVFKTMPVSVLKMTIMIMIILIMKQSVRKLHDTKHVNVTVSTF